jgi:hypothetical protein
MWTEVNIIKGYTHHDTYHQFERAHWPAMEGVRKGENQKDIERGKKDAAPKRKFREE